MVRAPVAPIRQRRTYGGRPDSLNERGVALNERGVAASIELRHGVRGPGRQNGVDSGSPTIDPWGVRRLLPLPLVVGSFVACTDECKTGAPSIRLELSADSRIRETVKSLEVTLELPDGRFRRAFDIGAQLTDGTTSLIVELDPALSADVPVAVRAVGYSELGATGNQVATSEGRFSATPNACNQFPLALGEGQTDAGLGDAATLLDSSEEIDTGIEHDAGSELDAEPMDRPVDLDATDPDAETVDGALDDGAIPDSGVAEPDSGVVDSDAGDTSVADLGFPDVGFPDLGFPDAGSPDLGFPDAGFPDLGFPDLGFPDLGFPDLGFPDAGFYGSFPFEPTNFDPTQINEPDPAVVIDCGTSIFNSSTMSFSNWCSRQPPSVDTIQQPLSLEVVLISISGLEVASGSTLKLVGTRPVIFAVAGPVVVAGVIDASANHVTAGAGGSRSCLLANGFDGVEVNSSGGGGGGAGHSEAGAAGGASRSGAPGGLAGGTRGSDQLSPIVGGCMGGDGGATSSSGGAGGGAVQISASEQITISGAIRAGGGGGIGANRREGGGGGGSGGAIFVEGRAVEIAGNALLSATGGAGGEGGGEASGSDGADGENGGGALAAAGGQTQAEGGNGGAGGAGAGTSPTAGGAGTTGRAGGGGGGGAAGRIRLRGTEGCSMLGTIVPLGLVDCP